jgi:hypothetical protein
MSRVVWPYLFTLRAAQLATPSPDQNLEEVKGRFFPGSNGTSAVALRWSSTPDLGFPREPFQVYRRAGYQFEDAAAVSINAVPTVNGSVTSYATLPGGDAAYVVSLYVEVKGGTATFQAFDVNGINIPNQVVSLSASGVVEFRCPGIAGITVSGTAFAAGSAAVVSIEAIGENVYANFPDWELIQTVGLPLHNNEIDQSYNTLPQGFWRDPVTPYQLGDGVDAAIARLFCTAEIQIPPGATGIADFPLPAWPIVSVDGYVDNLRDPGNLIPMIESCLENSVDSNPAQMQSLYSETVTTDGLNQIGVQPASPSQTSQVKLPVTAVAMLAVSTDPYAAVGLGYGTLDIPPDSENPVISVTISPPTASVAPGQSVQFTATVTGATVSSSVLWSVGAIPGGNSSVGTISGTGLYSAPGTIPATGAVAVYATSVQDPTVIRGAEVTIGVGVTNVAAASAPASTSAPASAPTKEIVITQPPPTTLPPVDQYGTYNYMVTAPFQFPFGLSVTLAALSVGQLPVAEPAGLTSSLNTVHAPLERDQAIPASIRISWNASSDPQGYGILVSRTPNQSEVLNAARPSIVGGYDVFVGLPPANPNPNAPADQQNPAFYDVGCTLPLTAPPVNNRYLVAAQDIFGQWSGWVETSTVLAPGPVTKPALISAEFLYGANSGSPPSPIVPASLQINFGWNWQDRAPGQIRFTGQFVPAPATSLYPPFLGGFAMNNTGPIGPPVLLSFSYKGVDPDTVNPNQVIPTITSGQSSNGPVTILGEGSPPAQSNNSDQVQYRVELTGIELDFSKSEELDFLIYATATEEVQPGVWSDPDDQPTSNAPGSPAPPPLVIGKIIRAIDPNPPAVHFAPPAISWTALPDATGNARGVLEWETEPSAAGYYVWEATETALLNLLPPGNPGGTPEPPANTPYTTRALKLKQLIDANQDASLQAFARLNTDMIQASSTEIVLPGAAETLYVYRISAIGANNVESARSSSVAIFAVPRRNVPGTSRILLRSQPGSGMQVIALPVESGATPAGYRLFRVRSNALSQDGSMMGPAKYPANSSLWKDYTSTTLAGNILNGKSLLDEAAIPSWLPYYYRLTAVGVDDQANGIYRGESPYSNTQSGYVLPAGPPLIAAFNVAISAQKTAALITLTTDLPAADVSPVGGALIELLQLDRGSPPGPVSLRQLLAVAPNTIAVGTLSQPAAAPAHASLARSAPDALEHWKLYLLIPYASAESGSFVLRLTDPLARQSTASF